MTNAIKLLLQIQIGFLQLESTLSVYFFAMNNNNNNNNMILYVQHVKPKATVILRRGCS
jgi:hypothetical protein